MKKTLFIFIIFLFATIIGYGQTRIIMNGSQAPTATGCNFKIMDAGAEAAGYAANTNTSVTIISNDPTKPCVEIEITALDIHESDTLYIYDGSSSSDPLIVKLNNSNYSSQFTYIYTASITSTRNITIQFYSDATNESTGFVIEARCVKDCQRVFIELDSVNSTHIPALDPSRPEDENLYINVCPYDSVVLAAKCVYPDNGLGYQQSHASTIFTFDYGDTVVTGLGLTSHSYKFIPERGYTVSIMAEDQDGCTSKIPVIFRVRTSKNPINSILEFPDYCTGQKIQFRVGYDLYADFRLDSVGSEQLSTLSVTDTIYLPDGVNCGPPNYTAYRSPVNFTAFSPNAVISQASDILYVRLTIEHSYIGDIRIKLICPSGNNTLLLPDYRTYSWSPGSTSAYLGVPIDDSGGGSCDPTAYPMGVGWDYVWSENTTRGYVYAPTANSYIFESASGTVPASDVVNKTQFYKPYQSFSNMIGCPLNGIWMIEVEDTWTIDNGFVFGWEMSLSEHLLPQNWSYAVNIDSMYITGPGASEGFIIPDQPGDLHYVATIVDEFGCAYDTTFIIRTVAAPAPDLGDDVELCTGEMLHLQASFGDSTAIYYWNTGSKEDNIFVVSQGEYIVRVTTHNADSTLVCVGYDTITVKYLPAPHADFEASATEECSPLKLLLYDRSAPEDVEKSYVWRVYNAAGDLVFQSELSEPEVLLTNPGKYHVQLIITTDEGCVDSITKNNYLEVFPQPYAEFEAQPEVSMIGETGGEVYFQNHTDPEIANNESVSWYWDFGDGTTDSSALSLTHTYDSWGEYIVTFYISSSQGCSDEISHRVVIEDDLIFPNAITPNGDGINDVFAIGNLNTSINPEDPDRFRHNELHIYDRWGKLVYQANDYDTYAKDGNIFVGSQAFDGGNLPDGVYYFTFYYKGKAKTIDYHGSLTILRDAKN